MRNGKCKICGEKIDWLWSVDWPVGAEDVSVNRKRVCERCFKFWDTQVLHWRRLGGILAIDSELEDIFKARMHNYITFEEFKIMIKQRLGNRTTDVEKLKKKYLTPLGRMEVKK